jgi:hypothetical protein
MDGVHDMGGLDCFGKVEPEANEPVFHAPWEGRVLALQRAMTFAGAWNIDMSRAMQEKLPPHVYLGVSYYKRWALGMELNVIDKGLAEREEFDTGHALNPGKKLARKLTPDQLDRVFMRGSFGRPAQAPPRTCIRSTIQGCRATCAAMSAWSSWCMARMCSPIR